MEINFTKKILKNWFKHLFIIGLLICQQSTKIKAQIFYKRTTFVPQMVSPYGSLGALFNPQHYLLANTLTLYYGNQNVYATAYLPFVKDEYSAAYPVELFGPNYATGIALASDKDPTLGLYAPIEVVSKWDAINPPAEMTNYHAYAAIIPHDQDEMNYKGSLNTLLHLNYLFLGIQNPASDIVGVSALSALQKFTGFTHHIFPDDPNNPASQGWDGLDKAGNKTISIVISTTAEQGDMYPAAYEDGKINIYQISNNFAKVTYNIIGHESAHGIMDNVPLAVPADQRSFPRAELEEGFADIIGLAFENYVKFGNFNNPVWFPPEEITFDIPDPASWFIYPKIYQQPNTYLGEYYNNVPNSPGYEIHNNGSVLKYWFYLLNSYMDSFIDNKTSDPTKHYTTLPLVPGNKDATFKLALRIIFKTFTEKVGPNEDYLTLRDKTIQTALDMGYTEGSYVVAALKNAWFAVGVGNEPIYFNFDCGVITSGESHYNGTVSFPVRGYMVPGVDQTGSGVELIDCSQVSDISTAIYDPSVDSYLVIQDAEKDGIFDFENNLEKSKSYVSIHAFTIEARNWFKTHFNWDGIDGDANTDIVNSLNDPKVLTANEAYKLPDEPYSIHIAWDYLKENASIDYINSRYFKAINYFAKNQVYDHNDERINHPEWRALRAGLSRIFSLEIKNEFKAKQPVAQAPVWTFLEEDATDPAYFDFRYPELTNKPKLYKGNNWNTIEPGTNASLIAFWYYLLVHGTQGAQGYTNEKGNTYFVFPQNKDLILKVIWNAYQTLPLYSSIEDFRLATMQALDNLGYDHKSKEGIALYDAWAAVMNFPDYASTLQHYPIENTFVDPWSARFGVEVEYKDESARLFEVSENPAFSDALATVYRFKSYKAPDEQGMTWGRVNLEPKSTYYVRSRLLETGGAHRDGSVGCADQAFCLALTEKEKWTVPYVFYTDKKEVKDLSPTKNTLAPAWNTPFSWSATPGAYGYLMEIVQNGSAIPPQTFDINKMYDEDELTINYNLALSKDKSYAYKLAPKSRLGSPEGVKKVMDPFTNLPTYLNLTDQEKAGFPLTFGDQSVGIGFKTDIPKVILGTPADGTHVPMLGQVDLAAVKDEPRASHYRWDFFYDGDFKAPLESMESPIPAVSLYTIENKPYLEHLHTYGWTFTPMHKAELPFIPQEEAGETAKPFHFVVDKDLIPKPKQEMIYCAKLNADLVFHWEAVQGAKAYHLVVKNAATQQVISDTTTPNLFSDPIPGVSEYPILYQWTVSAGVKDVNGNWVWGPAASNGYTVKPPPPTNLMPDNASDVSIGNNHSVTVSWNAVPGIDKYVVTYSQLINGVMTQIGTIPVTGLSATLQNLDYDSQYQWTVHTENNQAACNSSTTGSFKTGKNPAKYDMGFTIQLHDPVGPKKEIVENSFICNVQVKRPDGTVEFNQNIAANSIFGGIAFEPGNNTQVGGNGAFINGQLLDQSGDYTITLKIISVFSGLVEPSGQPQIICNVQEFKKVEGQPWVINLDIPTNPANPKFLGRVVGSTVKIKFHYELPN